MSSNPASLQQARACVLGEPEPDVAHLLAVALAIVRQHVHEHQRPPGLRTRATSASACAGSGTWCSTSIERRGIEPRIVDRQRLELAAAELDVVERCSRFRAACSIAADASTATTRARTARARRSPAGAAAEVADDPLGDRRARRARPGESDRRTARRAADPTGRPTRRKTPATSCAAPRARSADAAGPGPRPASARPVRARAATAAARTNRRPSFGGARSAGRSRHRVERCSCPRLARSTQPPSASAFR